MNRSLLKVSLLLCIAPLGLFGGQDTEGTSPTGNIQWELRGTSDNDSGKEIWLSPKDNKAGAIKLCATPGFGNLQVYFAPDEHWIIVQDGGPSLGVSLRLFERGGGVAFQEREDVDIGGSAEKLALKEAGLVAKQALDHSYVQCLGWSNDSKRIVVQLSGKGATPRFHVEISNWRGIYDVASSSFSFDLAEMNRGALTKQPKP